MSVVDNIHVLHIVSGDLWAGAEVQLFTLAKTQNCKPGLRVSAVVLNHGRLAQRLRDTGIEVTILDETKLNGFQILININTIVKAIRPDVIHTHRHKENILGGIAARLGNIPSLRTAHGAPEHHPAWYHIPKRLIFFLDWFSARYLQQAIIAVSQDLAGILAEEFPAGKIKIIENGIDLKALSQYSKVHEINSHSPATAVRIGIAGRLVDVKRVDIFIQAARQFLDDHPALDARFYIFGDGPGRRELESLSRTLNNGEAVRFEGHTDDIHNKLRKLDALLMTSDHEGLPMVLLEAMAMQVPVIAHAVGGIPRLLDHGNCGILVDDHSPAGYANAIDKLINDNAYRTGIIKNALERVTMHYSAESNADAYLDVYKELLGLCQQ